MSLFTHASGLEAILKLVSEVERYAPGAVIAVQADASLTDYSRELPSCRLTLRTDSLPADQIDKTENPEADADAMADWLCKELGGFAREPRDWPTP